MVERKGGLFSFYRWCRFLQYNSCPCFLKRIARIHATDQQSRCCRRHQSSGIPFYLAIKENETINYESLVLTNDSNCWCKTVWWHHTTCCHDLSSHIYLNSASYNTDCQSSFTVINSKITINAVEFINHETNSAAQQKTIVWLFSSSKFSDDSLPFSNSVLL